MHDTLADASERPDPVQPAAARRRAASGEISPGPISTITWVGWPAASAQRRAPPQDRRRSRRPALRLLRRTLRMSALRHMHHLKLRVEGRGDRGGRSRRRPGPRRAVERQQDLAPETSPAPPAPARSEAGTSRLVSGPARGAVERDAGPTGAIRDSRARAGRASRSRAAGRRLAWGALTSLARDRDPGIERQAGGLFQALLKLLACCACGCGGWCETATRWSSAPAASVIACCSRLVARGLAFDTAENA